MAQHTVSLMVSVPAPIINGRSFAMSSTGISPRAVCPMCILLELAREEIKRNHRDVNASCHDFIQRMNGYVGLLSRMSVKTKSGAPVALSRGSAGRVALSTISASIRPRWLPRQ